MVAGQHLLGTVDAKARQELVGRFAKRARKRAVVMERGQTCLAGRMPQANGLVQARCQEVAGAAKASESFLFDQRPKPQCSRVQQGMLWLHGS